MDGSIDCDLLTVYMKTLAGTLIAGGVIYILSLWMRRLGGRLGKIRQRLESEYESLSDEDLLEILLRDDKSKLIETMAAMAVAQSRLDENEEIRKAIRKLQYSNVELIKIRAKNMIKDYMNP